jgi:hypothetical protein
MTLFLYFLDEPSTPHSSWSLLPSHNSAISYLFAHYQLTRNVRHTGRLVYVVVKFQPHRLARSWASTLALSFTHVHFWRCPFRPPYWRYLSPPTLGVCPLRHPHLALSFPPSLLALFVATYTWRCPLRHPHLALSFTPQLALSFTPTSTRRRPLRPLMASSCTPILPSASGSGIYYLLFLFHSGRAARFDCLEHGQIQR